MEEWIKIDGYTGYEVSNYGKVKALSAVRIDARCTKNYKEKILKPSKKGAGYLSLTLFSEPKKPKQHYVHRLVALSFCENPNGYQDVNHKDGDKTNNMFSNLEWVSKSQNQRHRFDVLKNGNPSGESNKNTKYIYLQLDLNGNLIFKFYGIGDVVRYLGLNDRSGKGIRRAIKRNGTYKGFRWTTERKTY